MHGWRLLSYDTQWSFFPGDCLTLQRCIGDNRSAICIGLKHLACVMCGCRDCKMWNECPSRIKRTGFSFDGLTISTKCSRYALNSSVVIPPLSWANMFFFAGSSQEFTVSSGYVNPPLLSCSGSGSHAVTCCRVHLVCLETSSTQRG